MRAWKTFRVPTCTKEDTPSCDKGGNRGWEHQTENGIRKARHGTEDGTVEQTRTSESRRNPLPHRSHAPLSRDNANPPPRTTGQTRKCTLNRHIRRAHAGSNTSDLPTLQLVQVDDLGPHQRKNQGKNYATRIMMTNSQNKTRRRSGLNGTSK